MFDLERQHEFFIGIDSDGCTFDTMELKHKECFIPNTVNFFELQGISKYVREAAEFVNLYSKSRGINRFPALIETLEWLQRRRAVVSRGFSVRVPDSLRRWMEEESVPGNPALEAKVNETQDPDLETTLAWSKKVNRDIAGMVRGVPPFPYVRECLERLVPVADLLVVSATPNEALQMEWEEHDLAKYVKGICGQESGTKSQTLANGAKYARQNSLMVGDAPGDQRAAAANTCLFFPINPGAEEESWKRLFDEGIDCFLEGRFAGQYQQQLLDEFDRCLPEKPPWPVMS